MLNQYVNMSPQQRMAQMLQQQQGQQTQLQGQDMGQMPQAQNPFGGASNVMNMYGKMNQMQKAQEMEDYLGRIKASGGMGDMAAASGGNYSANNGT